ncbi:MAG TPA: SRPBCC family protein [Trebonia sp.]|jgi:uncharacterized membrane protein
MASNSKTDGPLDRLKAEAGGFVGALADRAVSTARDKVEGATGRLTEFAEGDGGAGLMAAFTGAKGLAEGKTPTRSLLSAGFAGLKEKASGIFGKGKGKGGGRQKLKLTNIVETIDVGVPLRVAYNQWTSFPQFPTFMKKVENAQKGDDDTKLNWKAQVFWSHRTWEASIIEQRPDERIIWQSKGQKGHVNGTVSFHELTPNLTRIVVVLEYHPQGMFEHTGNLWRAQGRRARLELKHFQRHVMTSTILHPDEVEGWRGVIEDGEVVKDHETGLREEEDARGQDGDDVSAGEDERPEDEAEPTDETESEGDAEEPADEETEDDETRADSEAEETRPRRAAPRRQSRSGRTSERSRSTKRSTTRGGEG